MKKTVNILISIIFLISFIGVQVHKHYSHGKLYCFAIYAEPETCCENTETCEMSDVSPSCKHQKQHNCSCKNETKTYKLGTKFIISQKLKIIETPVFDFVSIYCSIIVLQAKELTDKFNVVDISPPSKLLNTQSVFGVFLC